MTQYTHATETNPRAHGLVGRCPALGPKFPTEARFPQLIPFFPQIIRVKS